MDRKCNNCRKKKAQKKIILTYHETVFYFCSEKCKKDYQEIYDSLPF